LSGAPDTLIDFHTGGRLSDEEIGDVAAYVIDQANGDKWDD